MEATVKFFSRFRGTFLFQSGIHGPKPVGPGPGNQKSRTGKIRNLGLSPEIMRYGKQRIPDEKLGQGYFEPLLNLKK